jgi:hypothetical protein
MRRCRQSVITDNVFEGQNLPDTTFYFYEKYFYLRFEWIMKGKTLP